MFRGTHPFLQSLGSTGVLLSFPLAPRVSPLYDVINDIVINDMFFVIFLKSLNPACGEGVQTGTSFEVGLLV